MSMRFYTTVRLHWFLAAGLDRTFGSLSFIAIRPLTVANTYDFICALSFAYRARFLTSS